MKKIYMKKLVLVIVFSLFLVGANGQTESLPYKKGDVGNVGVWTQYKSNVGSKQNWDLSANDDLGLFITATKMDAGQSLERNVQHWAISPKLSLESYDNFLVFSDKRGYALKKDEEDGSTYTLMVGYDPDNLGSFQTLDRWKNRREDVISHKISLKAYSGQEVYIAFVRTNEGGASWSIYDFEVNGSSVPDVPNFDVSFIDDSNIGLTWQGVEGEYDYLLVKGDSEIYGTPVDGNLYASGNALGNGTIIYAGDLTSFTLAGLPSFKSEFFRLWVLDKSTGDYSLGNSFQYATTTGPSTIFYEDFEGLSSMGALANTRSWLSGRGHEWTIIASNVRWADNWLINGEQTSFRGKRSAFIRISQETIPNYGGSGVFSQDKIQVQLSANDLDKAKYKSAELSFYWKGGGKKGFDYGDVVVIHNNQESKLSAEGLYGKDKWTREVFDITDFLGKDITLEFRWNNSASDIGVFLPSFAVDEVYINGKSLAKPLAISASVVNNTLVEVDWQKNEVENDVLLVYSKDGVFGNPVDGQEYAVGSTLVGGGKVLYLGADQSYLHQIETGMKAFYRIWSVQGSSYSTSLTTSTVLAATLPFFDDFEADEFSWNVIPSTYNSWYHGEASAFPGSKRSAYVSKDRGFTTRIDGNRNSEPADVVLELPVNLAGFSKVNLSFDYLGSNGEESTYGYVTIEGDGPAFSWPDQLLRGSSTNWTSETNWSATGGANFGTSSSIRFSLRTYNNIDVGFVIDNVLVTGELYPVTNLRASNHGGLKNYLSWDNAGGHESLEVIVVAVVNPFEGYTGDGVTLETGLKYMVGDAAGVGRIVHIGSGESYTHEPVMGGAQYGYLVFQKNGLTYSEGVYVDVDGVTPENVSFYEDFENGINGWNIGTSNYGDWIIDYPSSLGNGTQMAFVSRDQDELTPGYYVNKHEKDNAIITLEKNIEFENLDAEMMLSFEYYIGLDDPDFASYSLSGEFFEDIVGNLTNEDAWHLFSEQIIVDSDAPEVLSATLRFELKVKGEENNKGNGFLLDNISISGANDRNSYILPVEEQVPVYLSSLADNSVNAIELFKFKLGDAGGDEKSTNIHQLTFSTGAVEIEKRATSWQNVFDGVSLYRLTEDLNKVFIAEGIVGNESFIFEGEAFISIAESDEATFLLEGWAAKELMPEDNGKEIRIELHSSDIIAYNGSSFLNPAESLPASSESITLGIVATHLQFVQEPSFFGLRDTPLSVQPIVVATDRNGNLDNTFNGSIQVSSEGSELSTNSGSFSLVAQSGVANFELIKVLFNQLGKYVLYFQDDNESFGTLISPVITVLENPEFNLSGKSFIKGIRIKDLEHYSNSRPSGGYEFLADDVLYLTIDEGFSMESLLEVKNQSSGLVLGFMIDFGNGFEILNDGTDENMPTFSNGIHIDGPITISLPANVEPGFYNARLALVDDVENPSTGHIIEFVVRIADVQWLGNYFEWDIPENWSNRLVPEDGADVVVPANPPGGLQPVITTDVRLSNVVIERGGSLTVLPGRRLTIDGVLENEGEVILRNSTSRNGLASFMYSGESSGRVELIIPDFNWYYLSSPFVETKFSSFDFRDPSFFLYTYDGRAYKRRSNADDQVRLLNMEGFSVINEKNPSGSYQFNYTGVFNGGLPVSRSFSRGGWYLLGNPYPSFIDWQNSDGWERSSADVVDYTMWYRTKVGEEMVFITYNRDPGIPENTRAAMHPVDEFLTEESIQELSLIPPYQSVWIKVLKPTTVTVKESARSHGIAGRGMLKSSGANDGDVIRISSSNVYTRDGAVIYFSENASDSQGSEDSDKYFNSSVRVPEVYTRVGSRPLAINGLSKLVKEIREIPISVRNRDEAPVTLKFDLSAFTSNHSVVLIDREAGEYIPLSDRSAYTYVPNSIGDNHERFILMLTPNVTTDLDLIESEGTDADSSIKINNISNKVLVTVAPQLLQDAGKGMVEIYNLEGKKISELPISSSRTLVFLPTESSVYIVRAKVGNLVKSERVIGGGSKP